MSKDVEEEWIHLDGPEPESIRLLLDALRALPEAAPVPLHAFPTAPAPAPAAVTAPALDIPGEVRARPEVPRAAKTLKVPVMPGGYAETLPLGDDSVARVVAALPFIVSGEVQFPRLTVHAYASLRAELWVWPDRWQEILVRYHVPSAPAWRALSDHWGARLSGDAGERAAFEQLVVGYVRWLREWVAAAAVGGGGQVR